jgi:hypothetical protein
MAYPSVIERNDVHLCKQIPQIVRDVSHFIGISANLGHGTAALGGRENQAACASYVRFRSCDSDSATRCRHLFPRETQAGLIMLVAFFGLVVSGLRSGCIMGLLPV